MLLSLLAMYHRRQGQQSDCLKICDQLLVNSEVWLVCNVCVFGMYGVIFNFVYIIHPYICTYMFVYLYDCILCVYVGGEYDLTCYSLV